MTMTMTMPLRFAACRHTRRIGHQLPSEPDRRYAYRRALQRLFRLGRYLPYPARPHRAADMDALAAFKYIHGNATALRTALAHIQRYLEKWSRCMHCHSGVAGSFCADADFDHYLQTLFDRMEKRTTRLQQLTGARLRVFRHALEFLTHWNALQEQIVETFTMDTLVCPDWYERAGTPGNGAIGSGGPPEKTSCAACHQKDAIAPPVPVFLTLAGYFSPRPLTLPNGLTLEEGVHIRTGTDDLVILHEHVHAYLHQKKDPAIAHPTCDWIEEGLAGWAAHRLLQPATVPRSHLNELYDFWIIMNSLAPVKVRALVVRWCEQPDSVDWSRFVAVARECLQRHYRAPAHRTRRRWSPGERLDEVCAARISAFIPRREAKGR